MQKKLKLINIQSTHQKYYIMQDQQELLGQGGFGKVKKAFPANKPQQIYAVKVIICQDQNKRKYIQRQLKMLEKIPDHKNIVKSKLLNCYSEKNFYIFMQYCEEGTLEDQCQRKNYQYTEQQIFNIFYQLMEGYKILYQNKIVHQDIKSQNILIHNGIYKIADFGLAIINSQGQIYKKREGTRYYIAPEKYFIKNLEISHKVDIYAFGVLLFELIIGAHPYVNKKANTILEYVSLLKQSKLTLPQKFSSKFTIQFKIFFDLVLDMIKKNPDQRISFEQIMNFIKQNPINKPKQIKAENILQKKFDLNLDKIIITGISKLKIAELYTNSLTQNRNQNTETIKKQIIDSIYKYLCSRRVFIYFLDRLARRLIVQQIKKNLQKTSTKTNFLILTLLYFNQKISNQIMYEIRNCQVFPYQQWNIFRQSNEKYLIERIEMDWQHINDIINNFIEQSNICRADQIQVSTIMSENNFVIQSKYIIQKIKLVLTQKAIILDVQNQNQLVTLRYLFDVIDFLRNNTTNWIEKSDEIERYYRKIEIESKQSLVNFIIEKANIQKIHVGIDISNFQFDM